MKRKCFMMALALLCAVMSVTQALASENLIKNGDISAVDGSGDPEYWARDMWYWDEGVSELTVTTDAYDGNYALSVHSFGQNDARFEQTVDVKPDTCYRITAMVKVEGADTDEAGASISLDNTFVSSEKVHDTAGAWHKLTLTGRTDNDQTSITVMLRVGGYGSLNVGRALFDAVEMVEIDEVLAGSDAVSFATLKPSGGGSTSEAAEDFTMPWTALNTVVALLYGLIAAALLIHNARRGSQLAAPVSPRNVLAILLVIAMAVRIVISMSFRGFQEDMSCFESWALTMARVGPTEFYAASGWCDYPPGYMYVLWLVGTVANGLSINIDSQVGWMIVKFVPMLMDIAGAIVVYYVVGRAYESRTALILAALMAFNPASIVNSAAWGQVDSVLALMLVLSMLMAARGRWFISLPVFVVAILIKPQALMFAPLGLIMIVYEVVLSEQKGRVVLRLLGATVLSLALMYLLALPFTISLADTLLPEAFGGTSIPSYARPVAFLIDKYMGTMGQYDYLSVNALNLYALLGLNWTAMDMSPGLGVFAGIMMGASYLYAAFLYIRAKDRGKIFVVAAMLLSMVFAVGPMMHERYLYPALIMLLIAYAFDRDARLLIAFAILSVTQFLNAALVLEFKHLMPYDERAIYAVVSLVNVLAAAFLGWTGWEMCVGGRLISFTKTYKPVLVNEKLEKRKSAMQDALMRPRDARLGLKRKDAFFMITLTVAYALVAFLNLGSTSAPETQWRSTAAGEEVTFDLGEVRDFRLTYYGGICNSSFLVQMSDDAQIWSEPHYADYHQQIMYRWLWYEAGERDENGTYYSIEDTAYPMTTARYIRITAERPGLLLNEVAFIDEAGTPLAIASVYSLGGVSGVSDPSALVDEQRTVPPYPSYLNGMYFDEIYHGRTAYEHLNGLHAYEWTHPPLGKVLIMIGIELFGMTPFGWRFVPALFGVLMVPLMYLMAKQLFKRSSFALIAGFLMAVDSMHFTQSRFATLDAIAVFFIMLMYFFMIRYAQMSFYHQKLSRTLVPLGLSGLSMGLAIATKWVGMYGALGLAFILFFTLAQRLREYGYAKRNLRTFDVDRRRVAQRAVKQGVRYTLITLAFCVLFFVVIPVLIYYFSYYWQLKPDGGLSIGGVWQIQKNILGYHSGGALEHGFSSKWYEWPFIVKPMWYYSGNEFMPADMVSSISCMGNPVVWWGGFVALIWMMLRLFTSSRGDRRYLMIFVGYLSQYVPWWFVERSTFIYHYFACVPFLILATVALFEWIRKRSPRAYRISSGVYCGAALTLFAAFYPLMSGLPASRSYVKYLRWFDWINY